MVIIDDDNDEDDDNDHDHHNNDCYYIWKITRIQGRQNNPSY